MSLLSLQDFDCLSLSASLSLFLSNTAKYKEFNQLFIYLYTGDDSGSDEGEGEAEEEEDRQHLLESCGSSVCGDGFMVRLREAANKSFSTSGPTTKRERER